MNFKRTFVDDKELFFDFDQKRTSCRNCGELIRFAQDSLGKHYPISQTGLNWHIHRCAKIAASHLEESISQEEMNQEYLNNL